MKTITECLEKELRAAFDAAGYDKEAAAVRVSDRPDLCEYQCNGAMKLAKIEHRAPMDIAKDVALRLSDSEVFESVEAVKPGFLNMNIDPEYLAGYLRDMSNAPDLGDERISSGETIIIDYGGPNVAKPLHVGHLRSAVIGECVKRMGRYCGYNVLGDVHMGDFGLQMGLVICGLKEEQPSLVYFDASYEGEYPDEPPFTASDLERIYPQASARSKEDEDFYKDALLATAALQEGDRGYNALLDKILEISVADMKANYERLDVDFDLWLGESDAQKYIPDMLKRLEDEGYAHLSDGALVIDVTDESDAKEIPPCIVRKSDGASLYATTDLATLVQRMEDYKPSKVIYVTDKRQSMHFVQVFRAARKSGIVPADVELCHIGFGTMNGKDGQPFKTREGGVMKLSGLLDEINAAMLEKLLSNKKESGEAIDKDRLTQTAGIVALAAVKYGDLSNQAKKDYIFDMDKFTSFEGNTGPYILYTMVRIKSILRKYEEGGKAISPDALSGADSYGQKALMNAAAGFNGVIADAFRALEPHRICSYIHGLCEAFNRFYHETRILGQEDEEVKASYIALISVVLRILEACIDVLGFTAPDAM